MQYKVVSIDGPAGSGKSSVAKLLASKLNYQHVNSGSLYRAISYLGLSQLGSDFVNSLEVISRYLLKNPQTIQMLWSGTESKIIIAGQDVTKDIRDERLNDIVSIVAAHQPFRNFVTKFMIRLSHRYNLIVDGRDIGTIVFPDAFKKFYFTADINTRAKRRATELKVQVDTQEYQKILNAIIERDKKDTSRENAPLAKADDAILIDTEKLSVDEVVDKVYNLIN